MNHRKQPHPYQSERNRKQLELQDKHGNKCSRPQCKLWAHLIDSENGQWIIWNDLLIRPSLALHSPKSCRRNVQQKLLLWLLLNIFEVHRTTIPSNTGVLSSNNLGISPGKKAKLRKEYIDQLKDIQKLRDDATLTQEEF